MQKRRDGFSRATAKLTAAKGGAGQGDVGDVETALQVHTEPRRGVDVQYELALGAVVIMVEEPAAVHGHVWKSITSTVTAHGGGFVDGNVCIHWRQQNTVGQETTGHSWAGDNRT